MLKQFNIELDSMKSRIINVSRFIRDLVASSNTTYDISQYFQ